MSEQNEQSVSSEQQTSGGQTAEPTLDDVYKQFNVEETANTFQQQPVQQQVTQQPQQSSAPALTGSEIPDPILDQNGFRSWLATQNTDLRKTLGELRTTQQQIVLAEMRRREESDIQSAVRTVKSKFGEIDDDAVEIALGVKARKDPRFMSIYQNRYRKPEAWNAALNAVANELKGRYTFRQDSQLTENVRAAKQSTQSSLTTKDQANQNPLEDRLSKAQSQREFDQVWSEMQRV